MVFLFEDFVDLTFFDGEGPLSLPLTEDCSSSMTLGDSASVGEDDRVVSAVVSLAPSLNFTFFAALELIR